jgi:ribosome-associated protein
LSAPVTTTVPARERAEKISHALVEKGGLEVRLLDLGEEAAFTDFFVIATGTSDRHVKTLADAALETARLLDDRPLGVEGTKTGRWVLVDLGDVVVHLFRAEAREFYGLERLWGEDEDEAEPRPVEAAQ